MYEEVNGWLWWRKSKRKEVESVECTNSYG